MDSKILFLVVISLLLHQFAHAEKKSYIVYLGGHSQTLEDASLLVEESRKDTHCELLGTILGSKEKANDAIFYSYTKSINGFAAVLEEEEAKEISRKTGVLSVIRSKVHKLHTTRSWGFLDLEKNGRVHGGSLWKKARYGEDTIIANLDSGVWPESKSFDDEGMGPIPSRWKGSCHKGFPCNRKLIGARFFNKGYIARGAKADPRNDSPRDTDGHGSHTLSTAGGRFVANASIFNIAKGTAKGGSPNARVAAYKVCWPPLNDLDGGCEEADIIAAFDAAIHDGVDVISVSLGGLPIDYLYDAVAIGSFHAVKNGIAVICSAGNLGPYRGLATNVAPWIFTVGASTIDRDIHTYLSLGNKKHIKGLSLSAKGISVFKPMVSSEDVKASNASKENARGCAPGSLDPEKVKGKIVVCIRHDGTPRVVRGKTVKDAGGAGMVLANSKELGYDIHADPHLLPAIHISYSDSLAVVSYMKSTKSACGHITFPKTEIDVRPAPIMAEFSSQGPNALTPEILKPDITAPGVNILAAYSQSVPPSDLDFDKRRIAFNFLSGTSMSCPHIAGVVGLLKTLYPNWSPSAIRSAIMTTAMTQDDRRDPISIGSNYKATPFSYGSGHVHPNKAADPGLVYDLTVTDYLNFLCALGYNSSDIAKVNHKPYLCPSKPLNIKDLNYPSIAIPNLAGSVTVRRTVKNVGTPGTYHARVRAPKGVSVSVKPEKLEFAEVGEEKAFEVTLHTDEKKGDYVFGTLVWSDGKHFVRSPIAVKIGKDTW